MRQNVASKAIQNVMEKLTSKTENGVRVLTQGPWQYGLIFLYFFITIFVPASIYSTGNSTYRP